MFNSHCVRNRTGKWNRRVRSQRRDVRNFRLSNILRGRRIRRSRKTLRKWLQPQWMASPLQLTMACHCRCRDARTTKLSFPSWILRHGKDSSKTSCLSTVIGRPMPSTCSFPWNANLRDQSLQAMAGFQTYYLLQRHATADYCLAPRIKLPV